MPDSVGGCRKEGQVACVGVWIVGMVVAGICREGEQERGHAARRQPLSGAASAARGVRRTRDAPRQHV